MKGLADDAGAQRNAMDVAIDLISRPVNATAAKISNDIRAWQSMVKFGGVVASVAPKQRVSNVTRRVQAFWSAAKQPRYLTDGIG